MRIIFFSSFIILSCLSITNNIFSQVIEGTYAIKNIQTGTVLRIKDANKANGTPIVSYSPVNWKCVTWNFKHTEGNNYQLINLFSDKTLQPSSATEGIALSEQPVLAGAPLQEYEFIPVGKNAYMIRLKGSDLYITPADERGTINSPIILAKKTNNALQQWAIYEQHPDI